MNPAERHSMMPVASAGCREHFAGRSRFRDGYSNGSVIEIQFFTEHGDGGIILPGLGRVLSEKETIVVSGMMFMILHLSVPSAPHLLLMGITVGFVRVRSKSLWPCVLMHFTHNALCIGFEKWI